ncbi:MAG TPA: PAS domain-containing protein [Pseudomonas sp.]|nr:PAS domain-containing protein [Pseudomonas sp.]HKS15356.1 PAS domain-containing protein [Pseudomonas sp.]
MNAPTDAAAFESRLFEILGATLRAFGSVLPGNAEIVLHDLRSPEFSIAEIVNAHVTGRKKGDSVLAGMRTDSAFTGALEVSADPVTLLLDYPTYSRDGSALRSSTAFYRSQPGRPFAALCINVDNAGIDTAIKLLQGLVGAEAPGPQASAPAPAVSEQPHGNIEDLMREIISSAAGLNPGSTRADTKRANLLAVQGMQEKGLFLIKGGVEKAAAALGVTRYTIYNYLDELKGAAT